jgi:hypothetical protein
MKCQQHSKEVTAVCQWCGKQLCKLCIKKTNGKKAYCSACVGHIGDMIHNKQVDIIKKEDAAEKKQSNDYFNFSSLKRP